MREQLKVYIWFVKMGEATLKIYAVAPDLAAALRQVEKALSGANKNILAGLSKSIPQVWSTPFCEVNISDNGKALAFVSAGELK